ncbi:MAG: DNA polymerase III subunit gamma/tau [Pseudomonadota bacterium]
MSDLPIEPAAQSSAYRVLARKYRPAHFRDLIGQEAMVQTLTNAFAAGRIAHAFVLTGVRGVGKTTTARIIATGLNCERSDGPTVDPCGVCEACRSIAEGRNTDVLEMDAASNTSVNDVREIIESVRYRASAARYKVYIIDEVHMLSTSAFNALLKTLEEPPEHVKFVFATTEIRKVPVTVLSRCQRFDLRRIEPEAMLAHLGRVAEAEGAAVDPQALGLITRAAEGSVRDALSLLDQALTLATGDGPVDAAAVRGMLGLADRGRVIDLFEAVMRGDAAGALEELARQYADGADPAVVLRDLAELTHWISVLRVSPQLADDPTVGPDERARGRDLAGRLGMPVLTRAWQMLLKSLEEVPLAPNAMMAAEMALIRLTHLADLPPPGDLVRKLTESASASAPAPAPAPSGGGSGPTAQLAMVSGGQALRAEAPSAVPHPTPPELAAYARFEDILALLAEHREVRLLDWVEHFVELVAFRPGLIEFSPAHGAPKDLAGRLSQTLTAITGARWSVAVSDARGAPTLRAQREAEAAQRTSEASAHPLVAAALAAFPGAEISDVRPLGGTATPEPEADVGGFLAAVPEAGDEDYGADPFADGLIDVDDPFEED